MMSATAFGQSLFASQPSPQEIGELRARHLVFEACPKRDAVAFCRLHHSRLPEVQNGPWQYAFRAHFQEWTVAAAIWNNPSARTLPSHWLELRRMACSPDAPRNTASRFLGWMARYFREHCPERERLLSYQDTAVHTGTIYRAAGWQIANISTARVRDRSAPRVGTKRFYRSNLNGLAPDASSKVRWECAI